VRRPHRGRSIVIRNPRFRWLRAALAAAWLVGPGCTSLREIPRSQYAAEQDRRDVHLTTREGLAYEFDYVHVDGDTLTGFKRRDIEGPIDEYASLRIALDDVARLEARGVDWKRTTIVGGSIAVVVAAAGLAVANKNSGSGNEGSGGGKPPIP
jgi:hypothetical protein